MASKVPKFGAWGTGDENYTVYFDKARDSKHNGKKINPNDPEENPDMFRPIKRGADKQRTQAKVPHFGAWENGDSSGYTQTFETIRRDKIGGPAAAAAAAAAENEPQINRDMSPQIRTQAVKQRTQPTVPHFGAWENGDCSGYTKNFEKVRKNRHGEPTPAENGPQMNRDMPPQSAPSVQAQVQTQAPPASREPRSTVPQFGDWDTQGGGSSYTRVFDHLHKKHPYSAGPQPSLDVPPKPRQGNPKVPEFGDWEGEEAVQYTEYFENPRKINNLRPGGLNPTEPQMNRDVNQGQHLPRRQGELKPSSQVAPLHPNANFQPRPPATRGNQPTTIPNFGGWNNDPTQAEGYTGDFARAREEKQAPQHHTVPQPYNQQHRYNKQKQQPSCCTIL